MSGSNNYSSPNFVIPYSMPSNVPPQLAPVVKPIYLALQNFVQTLIYSAGIAPRNASSIFSSNNDPTAVLANNGHRFYTQATETLTQGAAINLYASLGTLYARNANATDSTKPCDGFCSQQGGLLSGQVGELILNDGIIAGFSGLTVGATYYLSTVNGAYTVTPPVAVGNLQQSLGKALTATSLRFWTGQQIQH